MNLCNFSSLGILFVADPGNHSEIIISWQTSEDTRIRFLSLALDW